MSVIVGKAMVKTNAGRWCIGDQDCSFATAAVTRWGLYVAYGRRGVTIVAECYGQPIAVPMSKLTPQQTLDMRAVRKMIGGGAVLSSIRSQRDAGIVWDHTGVYVP